ncbi:carboxypeptidase-like regulatory domain-containing protein [uncultured Tenacibaculum sp.]|uniref:carboxypeptidase-like regulatory domain-containing protein n=1 Tax=uncultured Tenacibaculum sp. TaxID=174713 RepID=UPI002604E2AE|nr:carboxypeptidase-like regulatory domain-containing protein [uncultured Tenacibaculum sp.]
MKLKLTIALSFFLSIAFGQIYVKGKVTSKSNQPLEGAAVFFNSTTIATITDANGEYKLSVPEGKYKLVASYLGYKTVEREVEIDKNTPLDDLNFTLEEADNVLNEVVIGGKKKIKSKKPKYEDFLVFREAFLGRTDFAEKCKIDNKKALKYYFDEATNTFSVEAKEPIIILNRDLGYKISYNLEKFQIKDRIISYFGYSKYEKLEGNNRKQKKWKKNRLKAYNGSLRHFLKTFITASTKEEGFKIDIMNRKRNELHPTDGELNFSRRIFNIQDQKGIAINFNKIILKPQSKLDSAIVIHQKELKYPKIIDVPHKRNVTYNDVSYRVEGKVFLKFDGFLKVTYQNEKEEFNYKKDVKKRLGVQVSHFLLFKNNEEILPIGQIADQNNRLVEGYWSYELFANALPLDYKPPTE